MGTDVVPGRVRWAVEVLDPQPADRILEIGCGPGVAAGLVCGRLESGSLLAIDRSRVAIGRTVKRNASHLDVGRLTVRESTLDAFVVPENCLDKAFAINVNLFWVRRPDRELDVLSRALRPGGVLHLLYDAGGPTTAEKVTTPISAALRAHGFTAVTTRASEFGIGVSAANYHVAR